MGETSLMQISSFCMLAKHITTCFSETKSDVKKEKLQSLPSLQVAKMAIFKWKIGYIGSKFCQEKLKYGFIVS